MSENPLLSRPGAFAAAGINTGVVAHYGDPLAEQRTYDRDRDGSGAPVVVDRSNLGIVRVAGPDRGSWLTSIASQVVDGMEAGESREMLLLSPQGRIEYAPAVIADDQALWLIVEHDQAQPLNEYLNRMKFMLRVEISDESASYAVLETMRDPRGTSPIFQDALIWRDPWQSVAVGGYPYTREGISHPGESYTRYLSIVPRERLAQLAEHHALAGVWAAEALRIDAWRPRAGTEVDDKSIPQELDFTRTAVHFDKGCYKGQETVARVHNLGHPPRRLVFLDIDGSEHTLPAEGSELFVEGKSRPVGRITSVALHHEAGPIALAVIKRAIDPDATLRAIDKGDSDSEGNAVSTEYAVSQTVIVDPDSGEIARKSFAGKDFLKR